MADQTWKAAERAIAALFGTVRIPPAVFGQRADRGSHAPDAETDRLALQIKHGYNCPGYLRDWITGIKKNTPVGKTGVVVWHPTSARFEDSLVILRAVDFAALVQPPPATADATCAQPYSLTDTPDAP
jgi:hypothetical protein